MDSQSRTALAERMKQEAQTDRAIHLEKELLERAKSEGVPTDSAALLAWFDGMADAQRFLVWRQAKLRTPPSSDTWELTRALLRNRLPELELIADDNRTQLEELRRVKEAATEGMAYAPDYEPPFSAEDELDR